MKNLLSLTNGNIANLTPYQPGKSIAALKQEIGDKPIIKLSSNENPLGPSTKVVEAIDKAKYDIHRYPTEYEQQCKQAIAKYHHCNIEQITLGNGSVEILYFLAKAFLNPDNECIFSQYSFAIYRLLTQLSGCKPVSVAHNQHWQHDIEKIIQAITPATRLVLIDNPINPLGTWLDLQTLKPLLDQIPSHALIVIDEAYYDYAVSSAGYGSVLPWLAQYPNLIVLRTFSKAYGLAGLRIGYSISHPDVANILNRVRDPFNVNSLAQAAAIAVLQDQAYVRQSTQINTLGKKQISQGLQHLGIQPLASATNFVTFTTDLEANTLFEKLLQEGIIIRPLTSQGLIYHCRASIGNKKDNQQFLDILNKVLIQS